MSLASKYVSPLLVAILLFSFVTRIWNLHLPQKYVFDEVYHAVTSKLIAHNDVRAYEWWNPPPEPDTSVDWLHPPLAKYTQAFSMLAFGENPFGWRISSAIFGVLVVLMTYLLAKNLFDSERIALLSALLASLDGLLLVQSRVAMNDIHVTFFILLTLVLYVKYRKQHPQSWKWLLAAGISSGLAVSTKWSGMFVVCTLWFFEGLRFLQLLIHKDWKKTFGSWKKLLLLGIPQRILFLLLIPIAIYIAAYTHMFLQGKSLICTQQEVVPNTCYLDVKEAEDGTRVESYISHFQELHHQIWWYQTNLEATHAYQSRPWQWWLNLRPVWYSVEYKDDQHISNIYAFGNPLLFWIADIALLTLLLTSLAALYSKVRQWVSSKKIVITQFSPLFFLVFSYFIVWLPWVLSPRIMFFYHYTPAVPMLAILLAYQLIQLWGKQKKVWPLSKLRFNQWIVIGTVSAISVVFFVWYPQWIGMSVPKSWANSVYFVVRSWK